MYNYFFKSHLFMCKTLININNEIHLVQLVLKLFYHQLQIHHQFSLDHKHLL